MPSFEDWLVRNGRKRSTIDLHLKLYKSLSREVPVFCPEKIEEFLLDRKKSGVRNATLNRYIDTIRVYGHYSGRQELTQIKYFKQQSVVRTTFTDQEIQDFINLKKPPNANREIWDKWTLWWKLVIFTGARPGEICALVKRYVDLGQEILTFVDTKTSDTRIVPLAPFLSLELKNYLSRLKTNELFLTSSGRLFSEDSWYHDFKRRIEMLGLESRGLTPYSFRHTFASSMLNEGVSVFHVQRILGHRNLETTAKYTHLVFKDIKNALKKHPIIRKQINPRDMLDLVADFVDTLGIKDDNRYFLATSRDGKSLSLRLEIKDV